MYTKARLFALRNSSSTQGFNSALEQPDTLSSIVIIVA